MKTKNRPSTKAQLIKQVKGLQVALESENQLSANRSQTMKLAEKTIQGLMKDLHEARAKCNELQKLVNSHEPQIKYLDDRRIEAEQRLDKSAAELQRAQQDLAKDHSELERMRSQLVPIADLLRILSQSAQPTQQNHYPDFFRSYVAR